MVYKIEVCQQLCKPYLQVLVKQFDGAIMGCCSSVTLALKYLGMYYPTMVVECCCISLYCLGRKNACRLKVWRMGQEIVLNLGITSMDLLRFPRNSAESDKQVPNYKISTFSFFIQC
jgi:hypothetical protein